MKKFNKEQIIECALIGVAAGITAEIFKQAKVKSKKKKVQK